MDFFTNEVELVENRVSIMLAIFVPRSLITQKCAEKRE